MRLSSKVKVAVLRGGPSSDYDTSLMTGGHILSALREMSDIYEPRDIFISKEGEWHREGLVFEPHHALRYTDVVWNALHGSYGADGQVARILESLKVPYTGSNALSSVLAFNHDLARKLYQENALPTPAHELVTPETLDEDRLIDIFRSYLHPVRIRPARQSSDTSLAYTFKELKEKIYDALKDSSRVLVEELIAGDEISCLVIERARGEKIYALIPSIKSKSKLKEDENKKIEEMAKLAHETLGLRHYSSSGFVITPKRKIYILSTNPFPAIHEDSLAHDSLQVAGWRPHDFVDHVLKLAM